MRGTLGRRGLPDLDIRAPGATDRGALNSTTAAGVHSVSEPARPPSQLDQLADRFVENYAAAHPDVATAIGVRGHDDRWPDPSPEGHAGHADPYANPGFQQIGRLVGVPPAVA
jgi:hypothetical protein